MLKEGLALSIASEWMQSRFHGSVRIYGAAVDSRNVREGDLFFACKGNRVDGHAYLKQAAEKGAAAAVVATSYEGFAHGLSLVRVSSPEIALQSLASRLIRSFSAKIIGVTGSAGKTTTKGFLAHLLASKFRVSSTPGNQNSQLGLPLTICNEISKDAELVVLEMGMQHAGEIATLVKIAPPHLAIITGAAFVHAENFASLHAIATAKAEILSHPNTILGIVDSRICNLKDILEEQRCSIATFGREDPSANYTLLEEKGQLLLFFEGKLMIELPLLPVPGKHNQHNFLAAAIAAHRCGVDWDAICTSMKTLSLPPGRLQMQHHQGITYINDAYNAAPLSMKAALDSLPEPNSGGRKIAVLGEMLELGVRAAEAHQNIGEYALERVDLLFCMGEQCREMQRIWDEANRPCIWFSDTEALANELKKILHMGDVVLIKGSRSSGISDVLPLLLSI